MGPHLDGEWPAPLANGRQLHPTDLCNHSKCFRSRPFATCPTSLGSGGATREGSSPFSCTKTESQENSESSTKSATGVGAVIDDCIDDSTRGRLVAALTDGLRRMLAEGDGEGARVVLRALEDVTGLVHDRRAARHRRGAGRRSDTGKCGRGQSA